MGKKQNIISAKRRIIMYYTIATLQTIDKYTVENRTPINKYV